MVRWQRVSSGTGWQGKWKMSRYRLFNRGISQTFLLAKKDQDELESRQFGV